MKKVLLILGVVSYCLSIVAKAQAPFTTMDSIDINHLRANVLMHGDMWYDPEILRYPGTSARCYATNDSENVSDGGGLWVGGYDANRRLHISAETYLGAGVDFWPGPLDGNDTLTYSTSQNWAKIWKVYNTDIQQFQQSTVHTEANTPLSILTWPGKGNGYATGNNGVLLTINEDMAPFVDINGNGIYEPLLGEYPDIKGDEALWWIWSDNGPTHNSTNGDPLDIEIHAMAYGYNGGTLIDNVIYYEYTIVNHSANSYNNFRFAHWDAAEILYPFSNFIGFDSLWRMGINYTLNDNGGGGGNPPRYRSVMSAITFIDLPGDTGSSYLPAGSFTYYNNDSSIIGFPFIDTQFNNYMRSKLKNGTHVTNDFIGRGIPSTEYGSGPECNYVYSGDPGDTTQWSECNCNNSPGDRNYVLSSSDCYVEKQSANMWE